MSQRQQQLLLDDLNSSLPSTRRTGVEEAQLRILQHMRQLEEQQLVKPAHGDEDDTYV